jgi:hypothetical protein
VSAVNAAITRTVVVLALLLAAAGLGGDHAPGRRCGAPADGDRDALTPYPDMTDEGFLRGATLDLQGLDAKALEDRLRVMHDRYHIDTVGVYRLDDPAALFAALDRVGMTAVIRLEAYDPETFGFTASDADRLVEHYASLLSYLAESRHRERVAYLAVNMPVDDPRVQARLGGVNTEMSASRQVAYAEAVVARLRPTGLPIYLGVFYGWDGGYQPPSYRSAGADGYFLTSYSYPGAQVPDEADDDDTLIDAAGRRDVMRRFLDQYGDAPVVVEYGLQTAEQHGNRPPNQTAGLVANRPAKSRALVATTRFYCTGYPSVRGTLYFGFNIHKAEGEPPARLDFALE